MINFVEVTNYLGESFVLRLKDPAESGFFIRSIDGLGPAKANVNMTDVATIDGSRFNSSRLQTRNIVISLGFLPIHSIENLRQLTYKIFPIKRPVKLVIGTDNRVLQTEGYVESNEPDIFSKDEGCQISIVCPDPNLYAYYNESRSYGGINALFEFPMDEVKKQNDGTYLDTSMQAYTTIKSSGLASLANYVNVRQNVRNSSGMYTPSRWYTRPGYINGFANGWENVGTTAVTEVGDMGDRSVPEGSEYVEHKILYSGEDEVGVIMRMHATGPASGVAVHDITTGESMRIDSTRLKSITGSDIIAGDDIVISTVVGDKYINLVRGGVSKNILNALTRDSEWFKLVLGENTFAYTAKRGFYNLQFTIENRILFEGV